MRKYRVNSSEHFNLMSMREKLYVLRDEALESNNWDEVEAAEDRISEVEALLDKAPYVGSLVDWSTLKRIREIKEERQYIRYNRCLSSGMTEAEAALAFEI